MRTATTTKGRVTLSAPIVFENGRTLELNKNPCNHVFDGHLYVPVEGSEDVLGAFRFFNPNGALETPYAYFVTAQIASMPSSLPDAVKDSRIVFNGLKLSDYRLIGDIKSLIPFGRVIPDPDSDTDSETVNPCTPAYVFACGAVDRVQSSVDRITFKIFVEQYIGPLKGKASIGVTGVIDISLPRWAFLREAKKRASFVRQGSYVAIEGVFCGLETVKDEHHKGVTLQVQIEDITLLGRAPPPSMETIDISDTDSPLKGKGKGKDPESPTSPLQFSFSGPKSVLGKHARTDESTERSSSHIKPTPMPVASSSKATM